MGNTLKGAKDHGDYPTTATPRCAPVGVNCTVVTDECHHAHPIHVVCNALRAKDALPNPARPFGFLHEHMAQCW